MNQHNDRVGWYLCLRLVLGAACVFGIFVAVGA